MSPSIIRSEEVVQDLKNLSLKGNDAEPQINGSSLGYSSAIEGDSQTEFYPDEEEFDDDEDDDDDDDFYEWGSGRSKNDILDCLCFTIKIYVFQ